jgi:hypothetical protein
MHSSRPISRLAALYDFCLLRLFLWSMPARSQRMLLIGHTNTPTFPRASQTIATVSSQPDMVSMKSESILIWHPLLLLLISRIVPQRRYQSLLLPSIDSIQVIYGILNYLRSSSIMHVFFVLGHPLHGELGRRQRSWRPAHRLHRQGHQLHQRIDPPDHDPIRLVSSGISHAPRTAMYEHLWHILYICRSPRHARTKATSAVPTAGTARATPITCMHHHKLVKHYLTRHTRNGYCGDDTLLITEGSTT